MSSFLDKMNLRPHEKRIVVIIGVLAFLVLNFMYIWPQFGEWGRVQQRMKNARQDLQRFQREVNRIPAYQKELAELQRKGGALPSEDQALNLSKLVYNQAALSGVQINRYDPGSRGASFLSSTQTNQFFEEQSGVISFTSEEKALVDFLYNLGAGDSLIRVRSMNLSPDQPARMKLQGTITLVASYQKQPPRNPAPATVARANPSAPAARATNAPVKPNTSAASTNPPRAVPAPIRK